MILFNVRVGMTHYFITTESGLSTSTNDYHKDNHSGLFSIYSFFGYTAKANLAQTGKHTKEI